MKCNARWGTKISVGKAKLEPTVIQFRGDFTFDLLMAEITEVAVRQGWLELQSKRGMAALELGKAEADKWALKIKYPKPLLDKLGVREDSAVLLVGVDDSQFVADLKKRTKTVSVRAGKALVDLIFWRVDAPGKLEQMPKWRGHLKQNGALWVVTPKGRQDIKEAHVFAAGKAYGLVDTKVVSFSERDTAHKMVIPVRERSSR